MEQEFLKGIKELLLRYKGFGDKTFEQMTDEQLFWQYNEDSNSVATIVKHLWGNMLSRWTDFLTSDGEKEWRKRDEEFDNDLKDRADMIARWEGGWQLVFRAIDALKEEDLVKTVSIGGKPCSVTEAIIRNAGHYLYHVGQIVYVGKMCAGEDWKTLTIPRKK